MMIRKGIALLTMTAACTFGAVATSSPASAAVPSTPCAVEDGSSGPLPCYWDANLQGNGLGDSYWIDKAQVFHYINQSNLRPGESIGTGDRLQSFMDGGYWWFFISNSRMVIQSPYTNQVIWTSGTTRPGVLDPTARLTLQTDGNVVLYGGDGKALWQTKTYGLPAARLTMKTSGDLVLFDANNTILWHSNSATAH